MIGVLFDMDGVLVDSFRPHLESWRLLARQQGMPLDEEALVSHFGRTGREIVGDLWPGSVAEAETLVGRKEALYRELVDARFPAMPGAVELVAALHQAGFALAVASSGPPENVAMALARMGVRERFAAVVTGRDVVRGKPDPQVFLLAAERLGLPAERCVVVEDAPVGIAAAHAAGAVAVALLSTGRRREDFAAVEPDLVVAALAELDAGRLEALLHQPAPRLP
jgi:beta-phosphoglucomutase